VTRIPASAIALLLAGIITPTETFAGFGYPAPVTVAALYVLARAAEKTGLMQPILERLLGKQSGGRWRCRSCSSRWRPPRPS
jgi:hypothetical protein